VAARRQVIPPDSRRLACGCGVATRCDEGKRLWAAVQGARFGSKEWVAARQAYYRHVGAHPERPTLTVLEEVDDADRD
jgi:hypothetical protein